MSKTASISAAARCSRIFGIAQEDLLEVRLIFPLSWHCVEPEHKAFSGHPVVHQLQETDSEKISP
jgi:hypothetical protein